MEAITEEIDQVLGFVQSEAVSYLSRIRDEPVRPPRMEPTLISPGPVPEEGSGAQAAMEVLVRASKEAAIRSVGPRFFHFVIGGVTPAALAADWWTAVIDQNAYNPVTSPLAADLENQVITWLKQLFELPDGWDGVLTTGGTMANFIGLAAARQWWGEQQGVDIAEQGMSALPAPQVLSTDAVHPSVVKALAMLGIGRSNMVEIPRVGREPDLGAMERMLQNGQFSIVVANAGEANAGDFDPIYAMSEVVRESESWLHVDAAFGIFARLGSETQSLTHGIERADSVAADAHKWLNVPHDCGMAFLREPLRLSKVFGGGADYIERPQAGDVEYGSRGPEMSRRARSMAVWATLLAYGKNGYERLVDRCLALTRWLAHLIDEAPELERLADVKLNVVVFRFRPPGLGEHELNDLNRRLAAAMMEDGRFYVGSTEYDSSFALRAVIINWRTTEHDLELLIATTLEIAAGLDFHDSTEAQE